MASLFISFGLGIVVGALGTTAIFLLNDNSEEKNNNK